MPLNHEINFTMLFKEDTIGLNTKHVVPLWGQGDFFVAGAPRPSPEVSLMA